MQIVKQTADAAVMAKVAEVEQFSAFGKVYSCKSAEDEAAGHEALGAIKQVLASAEAERKSIVEPIKQVTSQVDTMFRERIARPLEVVKAQVEMALRTYAAEQIRLKRAAEEAERQRLAAAKAEQERLEREAAEAAAAGDAEVAADLSQQQVQQQAEVQKAATAVVMVARPTVVATGNATGSYKTRRVATIVDPAKVPDVYWRPDLALVQRAVDEGAVEIAGVEIREEVLVSNRRK